MSRLLAVVANLIVNPTGATSAHVIVIDQDSGKGVKLDLDAVGSPQYRWKPLPDVPLHLLATEDEAEARRDGIRTAIVSGTPFDPERTLDSDLAEDRG
jgi:hypothetical protein